MSYLRVASLPKTGQDMKVQMTWCCETMLQVRLSHVTGPSEDVREESKMLLREVVGYRDSPAYKNK